LAPDLFLKLFPFINKRFNIDCFLDWESHHWLFVHLKLTTATHALNSLARKMTVFCANSSIAVLWDLLGLFDEKDMVFHKK